MVTPFDDDLALDIDAAVTLARWLVDHGNEGLVVAGTTGESPTLDDDEKLALWEAVAQAVTVPVIAGTGSNDTRHSVELTSRAADVGIAGVLAVTPYYSRPHQDGLAAHFGAMAAAAGDLPVMLYDIPVRTGRKIATDTLVALATEVPNIVAVKDAAGDPAESARMIARAPAGFELYSGDDGLTLPLVAVGAVGVVGVATHWAGERMAELVRSHAKGDVDQARRINAELLDSYTFESSDAAPNPLPAKAAMRALGMAVGQCRPPLGPAPEGLDGWANAVLADLGYDLPTTEGLHG